MALNYTVCENDAAKTVSIEMTVGDIIPFTYYVEGGCNVSESNRVLTFTADGVSDEDYDIWFNYLREYYADGIMIDDQTMLEVITMPAGQSVVTKTVVNNKESVCDYDSGTVDGIEAEI